MTFLVAIFYSYGESAVIMKVSAPAAGDIIVLVDIMLLICRATLDDIPDESEGANENDWVRLKYLLVEPPACNPTAFILPSNPDSCEAYN